MNRDYDGLRMLLADKEWYALYRRQIGLMPRWTPASQVKRELLALSKQTSLSKKFARR